MQTSQWIRCPICGNKTRNKIRTDTILINFPLFCPKCKKETIINVQQQNIFIIKEPDAEQTYFHAHITNSAALIFRAAEYCNIRIKNKSSISEPYNSYQQLFL